MNIGDIRVCMKGLHHPPGPFALMGLSGIDTACNVQQRYAETGDPAVKPAACTEEKGKAGTPGRKTGKGWDDDA
ncbi:3-hydroxyacyl-CoA dehydrogenase family protein [Brevibacillus sp. SYP-B805]|uniref:3-hydroxyacyl-CoA dehydrogenase family protein n=1 Tax=Brevibacillus sp. SYP-B805 TaxID=1578199 RepID=UPI0032176BF6